MKRILNFIIIIGLLLSSCSPSQNSTITKSFTASKGGEIEHPSGLLMKIPPDALFEDGLVTISTSIPKFETDSNSFVVSPLVYEIHSPNDGEFMSPIEIEIPYDDSILPDNYSIYDLFAVLLYDGTWYRLQSEINIEKEVIVATTMHNGYVSTAYDSVINWLTDEIMEWAAPSISFYCEDFDVNSYRMAKNIAEQRRKVLEEILLETEFKIEEIDAPTDDVIDFIKEQIIGELKSQVIDFGLKGIAEYFKDKTIRLIFGTGKDASIIIKGKTVGVWVGRLSTAISIMGVAETMIIFFNEAEALGDASFQVYRLIAAYKQFTEAAAVVYSMERGCDVATMPPEFPSYIKDFYVASQIDQSSCAPKEINLDISVYPSPTNSTYPDLVEFWDNWIPPSDDWVCREEIIEINETEIPQIITSTPTIPVPSETPISEGKIVFSSGFTNYGNIFVMNPDGSELTILASGSNWDPTWSPDCTKIAYTSNRGNFDIFTMHKDGSNQIRLTTSGAIDTSPAWSPDGNKIVYSSSGNFSSVYIMNADGSNNHLISNNNDSSPSWSPDGNKIIVNTYRDENDWDLILMDTDGNNQTYLTNNNISETNADWSPDGSKIAFQSNDGIYVMNANGTSKVLISNNQDYGPSWSPNGEKIVFYSFRDGLGSIYIMNSDGSNQIRITGLDTNDKSPDWCH